MAIDMKHEIRVIGIRRSGSHAIINWLSSLLEAPFLFFNNADPHTDPSLTARQAFGPKFTMRNQVTDGSPCDNVIVSYEEICAMDLFPLDRLTCRCYRSSDTVNIVILRDVFNMASSLLSMRGLGVSTMAELEPFIEKWKDYYRLFHDNTSVRLVLFNRWFRSFDYRFSIASSMNMNIEKEDVSTVLNFGGGSSFENQKNSNGSEFKVLERWKGLQGTEVLQRLMGDKELLDMTRALFVSEDIPDISIW